MNAADAVAAAPVAAADEAASVPIHKKIAAAAAAAADAPVPYKRIEIGSGNSKISGAKVRGSLQ